ncbi:MAG: type IX secretion system membrane protein PorP/SprF [Bacteroidetes bacterium]|nr:type IX secretion system membrane protein PorP/SprF [Bacteroidota bacterium]
MRNIFLLIVLLVGLSSTLVAQQEARYAQFLFHKLALNPGYAGARDVLSMAALYRHQWTGIDQAPRTLALSLHAPLRQERLALGFQLVHDRLGLATSTGLYSDWAYRIPVGKGKLSIGLQAGLVNQQLALTSAVPLDGNDPFLQRNQNHWFPNAGAGLYYASKTWYAGLSAPQLTQSSITDLAGSQASQSRHYAAMGGYAWKINPDVKLHPQALLLVAEGAPVQAEGNLSVLISERFWTGVGYRSSSTAVFNLGYEMVSGLRFGYAYDLTLGAFSAQTGGSHELMIGMDIGRNPARFLYPRQLSSPVF